MYPIKPIKQQVGYRIDSISLNSGGSISANFQIGSCSTSAPAAEGDAPNVTFTPIASPSYYITDVDSKLIMDAPISTEEESLTLREVLESRIEAVLRLKGQFNI